MTRRAVAAILILIFLAAPGVPKEAGGADFPEVTGPCNPKFPRDHAAHPEYRIEWWYYTGNLQAEDGASYGFQLTFFRIRTRAADAQKDRPSKASAWRTDQIFAAHAALSDISSRRFHHAEKMSRGALQLAGARAEDGAFEVFLDGWSARIAPGSHRLLSRAQDFSFDLSLVPRREPVAHGDAGYSRKGKEPSEASCYYSITRLEAEGTLEVEGRRHVVSGSAWMDHEYSSASLDPRLYSWDWFSLQISDGSDLMLYLMREKTGGFSPVSAGTWVKNDGTVVHLSPRDFKVEPKSEWKSPHTGAVYPASWQVEVYPLDFAASIVPAMEDQEMQSPGSTEVTYWEGSVRVQGRLGGYGPVTAQGYAELTGYADAARF